MLNEKCARLLDGLTEERGIDWSILSEQDHPVHVARGLSALRQFLGVPSTSGGIRPDETLLGVVLGFGRVGVLKLIGAYCEETLRTDAEAAAILEALATVARRARALRLIDWSIDDVKPEVARKPKLLVALPPDVDERLRSAAALRGESMTSFVTESVRARLAEVERTPRRAIAGGATAAEAR